MKNSKLMFDLTNNSTSEPILAEGVFSAALLQSGTINTFRQILNAKDKVKLGIHGFGDVLQSSSCNPSDQGAGELTEKEVDVAPIDVYMTLCQRTLEQSFLSNAMANGSNNAQFLPSDFQAYLGDKLAEKIASDLEVIAFQGDTGAGSYPLAIADGIEKELGLDSDVIDVANGATPVDSTNVIDEMKKVYDAIPTALASKPDLAMYVSSNIAKAYRIALAAASAEAFYNQKDLEMSFLDVEVIEAYGMSDDKMIVAQKENLTLMSDLVNDFSDIRIIPQLDLTGKHQIVVSGHFKFKTSYAIGADIVFYA